MELESSATSLPIRRSSRLIILDAENRLLLMQIKPDKPADPSCPILKPYWVTLGGGVEERETLEQAAVRELREETGITDVVIGPMIWHGQWQQGQKRINDEYYFLVKLSYVGGVLDHSGLEEEERAVIKNMKWWNLEEMESMESAGEVFIPRNMNYLLSNTLRGELPSSPVEIDLSTPN